MSVPPFKLYLFDVDGTLMDSAPDITGAVRSTLEAVGADGLSETYLRSFIGYHLHELFTQVFPGITQERSDELLQSYRATYLARHHQATRVYAGVEEMLAKLGGLKSTATTKGSGTTRNVLTQFGLARYFDHVQGTDGFPSKPEPDIVFKSLEHFGVAPEECLLIGDAPPDMLAGRRAGVRTCAAAWGYGDRERMRELAPDYWLQHPLDLVR